MAIPNPNPNIADGIKSDNKTYSSNKIESLISSATELPIPEAGDANKALVVNSDEDGYELTALPFANTVTEGTFSTADADPDNSSLTIIDNPYSKSASGYFKALNNIAANTVLFDLGFTPAAPMYFLGFVGTTPITIVVDNTGKVASTQAITANTWVNFSVIAYK